MTDRPLALGLVGCGRLAEVGYLPAVSLSRRVHLVAAADPDATRRSQLAAMASRHGIDRIATFPDAQRMIDDAGLDAVVVATPASAHVADARRAAAAGLAVLVEKPPALDAAAAAELVALSPRPGSASTVGSTLMQRGYAAPCRQPASWRSRSASAIGAAAGEPTMCMTTPCSISGPISSTGPRGSPAATWSRSSGRTSGRSTPPSSFGSTGHTSS